MKDSWTGLVGVEVEDASIALSQGAFYDRSKEHLVPADRAVVRVRRMLLDSFSAFATSSIPSAWGSI